MGLSKVTEAIERVRSGGLVIVVDDENRENEGDLIMAAEKANSESLAFMIRYTSGIICVPCEEDRLERLKLPQMVEKNSEPHRTAFTISVDYASGMTTGVSANERARTMQALASDDTVASDFVRPGHVFPLRYREGGVLVRSGHTEAAVDLCKLAGLKPVGVLSELSNADGTMMRLPELTQFAKEHHMPIISIESLIKHRAENDVLVEQLSHTEVVINGHGLSVNVYKTAIQNKYITAVVSGEIDSSKPTLVRIVRGAKNRDFFSSALVKGNVIHKSLELIAEAHQGVFIYLPPEQNSASAADEESSAVWREVGLGSQILNALGVRTIHLIASKELSFPGISSFGLSIETIIKVD